MYEFTTGVSKEQQRAVNDEKGHEFIRGTSGLGEHLEFIQDTNYEATSLSEQRERERRVVRSKDLSVKQQL